MWLLWEPHDRFCDAPFWIHGTHVFTRFLTFLFRNPLYISGNSHDLFRAESHSPPLLRAQVVVDELTELLIARRADFNLGDKLGATPLMLAACARGWGGRY